MRIGLIGLGAIGGEIAALARAGRLGDGLELAGILVRRARTAMDPPQPVTELAAFLATAPRAVLECAGHEALRAHGAAVLEAGADLIVTSAGALTDAALHARLAAAARQAGRRLVIAAAGIGALDILAGAAVGGLERVAVTVRKDPSAWRGTAAEQLVDLDALDGEVELYRGSVRDGARRYPQNVNIAAAAALAGIGLDRTELVITAHPGITRHIVELEAAGAFGRFRFVEEVEPTADNPKTGRLVAMAVVKTLRQLAAPVVVGG